MEKKNSKKFIIIYAVFIVVSNQQATEVIKQYTYEELFTIERDNNNNIRMIKSNVNTINAIISDIPNRIQKEINRIGREKIEIALRKFYRNSIFIRIRTRN